MEAVYTTDDSRFKYVFCYTDTDLPLDSYVTIDGFTTRMSKVYTSADGWNPSIGQPTQGVIGFNYDNINTFIFGQPFYINNSTGSYPVSGYLSQTDAVAAQLTTSLNAYTSAGVNTWVEVTQTEYQNVATNISGVIKTGYSDTALANALFPSPPQDYNEYWENFFGNGPRITSGYAWLGLAIGLGTVSIMPVDVKTFTGTGPCYFPSLTPVGGNSLTFTSVGVMSYFLLKQPTSFVNATNNLGYTSSGGLRLLSNNDYDFNGDFLKNAYASSPGGGCSAYQQPYSPITQALAINRVVWPT